ncbi:hypothetical protein ACSNNV_06525 [Faecalibacterium prausnitzii]|uniref:Uncharacterized protein n=1 Tax=Faecalibacterium prausnitzii L2-6 TaxID=718252 RepID=D4JYB1_9FIRM|nr:hypothetical protein FP2_15290 [Faecalibacterium prausnitzii L2-6]
MAQCRRAIAFLPFRASRVNDKKVNEENSNNKKEKNKGGGTLCIQQPAIVGYNNSTITEKLQALF